MNTIGQRYNLGTAQGRILIHTGQARTSLKQLQAAHARTIASTRRQAYEYRRAGLAFGAVALAAGAAFALAVRAAARFEQQISRFGAVTNASATNLDKIRQKALQLGTETTIGATEAAKAIVELGKAGLRTEAILEGAAEATVLLARAGEMPVAQAAITTATALNVFSLAADQAVHVANRLAGAANASQAEVSDIAVSLRYVGSAAASTGTTVDDVTTSLAVMAKNGLLGSIAGTALRGMMVRLNPITKKASNLMEDLGIITEDGGNKFFNASGEMRSMGEVSEILYRHTKNLTEAERLKAFTVLFGQRAMSSAIFLAKEGAKGFAKVNEEIKATTAEEVSTKKLDNLAGSILKLRAAWETALIKGGLPFQQGVRSIVDSLTSLITAFSDTSDGTKKWVGTAIAAVAVIAGLTAAVLLLAGAMKRMKEAWLIMSGIVGNVKGAFIALAGAMRNVVVQTINFISMSRTFGFLNTLSALTHKWRLSLMSLLGAITPLRVALVVAGLILLKWIRRKQQASAAAQEFTAALQAEADGVKDSRRNYLIATFGVEKYEKALAGTSVSMGDLVRSIESGKEPTSQMIARLQQFRRALKVQDPFDQSGQQQGLLDLERALAGASETQRTFIEDGGRAALILSELSGGTSDSAADFRKAESAADDTANAIAGVGSKASRARGQVNLFKTGMEELTEEATQVKNATDTAADALEAFFNPLLSLEKATLDFKDSQHKLKQALRESGNSISLNSEKGREARGVFLDMLDSAQGMISAQAKSGSVSNVQRQAFLRMLDVLTRLKGQFPALEPVIQGYIDKIRDIPGVVVTKPKVVPPPKAQTTGVGKTAAVEVEAGFLSHLDAFKNKKSQDVASSLASTEAELAAARNAGLALAKGIKSGFSAGAIPAYMAGVMAEAIARFKAQAEVKSPSRVFMKIGKQLTEGLKRGVDPMSSLIDLSVNTSRARAGSVSVASSSPAIPRAAAAPVVNVAPSSVGGPISGTLRWEDEGHAVLRGIITREIDEENRFASSERRRRR